MLSYNFPLKVILYPNPPDAQGRLHPIEWRTATIWDNQSPVPCTLDQDPFCKALLPTSHLRVLISFSTIELVSLVVVYVVFSITTDEFCKFCESRYSIVTSCCVVGCRRA